MTTGTRSRDRHALDTTFGTRRLWWQPRYFYGWVIVGVALLTGFFSGPGQSYAISEFIPNYMATLHLSRTLVSVLFSVATLAAGLLAVPAGRWVDRAGARLTLTLAAALLAVACGINSLVSSAALLLIAFFLVRLLGMGVMTIVPSTLVPQWFWRQRGRALSIAALGGVVGVALIPTINTWLIGSVGWQNTWRLWGAGLLLVFVPIGWILIRDRPEPLGLLPDGALHPAAADAAKPRPAAPELSWTLGEAARTTVFWLLLSCLFISSVINTGLIFQVYSVLGQRGVGIDATAHLLSVFAAMGVVGTLAAGYFADRAPVHRVWASAFFLAFVELALLLNVNSVLSAAGFMMVWGLSQSIGAMSSNVIWPQYFGRQHLGSIRGAVLAVGVFGSATGPTLFGWADAAFAGYTGLLRALLLLPLAAGGIMLVCRRPKKPVPALLNSPSPPSSLRH